MPVGRLGLLWAIQGNCIPIVSFTSPRVSRPASPPHSKQSLAKPVNTPGYLKPPRDPFIQRPPALPVGHSLPMSQSPAQHAFLFPKQVELVARSLLTFSVKVWLYLRRGSRPNQPTPASLAIMGRGRNPGPSRRGVDLTGIISFAEKEDLVILVSRITETMIRQMGDVFDSSTPTLVGPGTPNANTWVTISIPMERLGMDDKPDIKSESDETAGGTSVDTTDHNTGTIISPALSMPITTQCQPQLSELKKELFAVFKKWQGVVLQRVRDIRVMETTLQDHYEDQNFFGGRGRGYRGGRAGGRGGRGRGGVVPRTTGKYYQLGYFPM